MICLRGTSFLNRSSRSCHLQGFSMIYTLILNLCLREKTIPRKPFLSCKSFTNMPKKSKIKEEKSSKISDIGKSKSKGPIKISPEGDILMAIHAKPGAKQNSIADITEEGINIQINAPPVEGSANIELIKYMAAFLGLKSSSVTLERGHKSRNKVLRISGGIAKAVVVQKLNAELPGSAILTEDAG